MCGIAGIHFKNPGVSPFENNELEKMVDALLLGIEIRGTHATGIASVGNDGELHLEKADIAASTYVKWRNKMPETPNTILLHTRFATKGNPSNLFNNHPVQYEDYVAIHNGHISNDDELFENEKLNRIAQVDSEIIPALFHKYGFDKSRIALEKLDGNYAIAVIDKSNPKKLLLAKGYASPLVYIEFADTIIWASTKTTICDAFEAVFNVSPDLKSIKELALGEMMMIDEGFSMNVDFEPFKKPYVYTSYNHGHGDGWFYGKGSHTVPQKEEKKKLTRKEKKKQRKEAAKREKALRSKKVVVNTEYEYRRPVRIYTGREQKESYFTVCLACNCYVDIEEANAVAGNYYCDDCYTAEDAAYDAVNNGIFEDISDELDKEHWLICKLIAERNKVNDKYVNWLLFESNIEEGGIDDSIMITQYMDFYDEYEKLVDELENDFSFLENKEKERNLPAVIESRDSAFQFGFGL